jgi:hypothetical protein
MDLELTVETSLDNPIAHDLFLDETGQLVLFAADDVDAIAQQLRIRFKFFKGEWFLDRRQGIPYFDKVLIKNPSTSILEAIFRRTILDTPGVESLESFRMTLDRPTRILTMDFVAATDTGEVLDTRNLGPFLVEV